MYVYVFICPEYENGILSWPFSCACCCCSFCSCCADRKNYDRKKNDRKNWQKKNWQKKLTEKTDRKNYVRFTSPFSCACCCCCLCCCCAARNLALCSASSAASLSAASCWQNNSNQQFVTRDNQNNAQIEQATSFRGIEYWKTLVSNYYLNKGTIIIIHNFGNPVLQKIPCHLLNQTRILVQFWL